MFVKLELVYHVTQVSQIQVTWKMFYGTQAP